LAIIGLGGWLWFSAADSPAWKAVALVAVLALAALVGVAWYLPRVRTEGRWRAAVDRYAEQEQAKAIYPRRGSRR
jgi:membrane protein YdbS with pleckstrin-like domain